MADSAEDAPEPQEERVGEKLRAARISAGVDLKQISEQTRVPLRHLDAIERGDFAALPSFTYATGFVRAYARALGEDEVAFARALREELGREAEAMATLSGDEIADPARVPPRWLASAALFILVLFAGGYALWRSALLTPDAPDQIAAAANRGQAAAPSARPARPVPPAGGQVVLTAKEDLWFRVYDRNDKVLFEGIKKKGESFVVPADAEDPMIRTGRADQLGITVGGVPVPPLGTAKDTIKDAGISARALRARTAAPAATAPAPSPSKPGQP